MPMLSHRVNTASEQAHAHTKHTETESETQLDGTCDGCDFDTRYMPIATGETTAAGAWNQLQSTLANLCDG